MKALLVIGAVVVAVLLALGVSFVFTAIGEGMRAIKEQSQTPTQEKENKDG